MALFKCKMCGGELEVQRGMTICECPYCGTKQTLPNLDDEKRLSLYDRANHFRRNNEYDKAMDIYEKILEQDKEDAEAYWSIVLCRYGIEYVEDPTSHKRIPTVNRAQYTSVFIDEDYLSAIKYADGYQRDVYENEAKAIDEIQKNILSISAKEEPFDIFICYKETDSTGRRTEDSVYAQNIYKELTNEGYKVFFSRITLEDKLGTEYEPYIFAALNSSNVMIVVGTSAENLNSPWVQNEWSRYLNLIKSGEDKVLIPVYKNMSPYDLPEEFSYLQAQDMGKVGFMQDLVYGVKKIISQDTIDERQKNGTSSVIVETMTKRGGEALANSNWDNAIRCYDSILDYDPNNLEALEGKLKAIKQVTDLENSKSTLDKEECYKKILQIADVETKEKLEKINDAIKHKLKVKSKKRRTKVILLIVLIILIALAVTVSLTYRSHIKPFISYKTAESMLEDGKYDEAKEAFSALGEYKDSYSKVNECDNEKAYSQALNHLKAKDYKNSTREFNALAKINYKDSKTKYIESAYGLGCEYFDNKDYSNALSYFKQCNNYKDSNDKIKYCQSKNAGDEYKLANEKLKKGEYTAALNSYNKLGDYKDTKEKIKEAKYGYIKQNINNRDEIQYQDSDFYKYITQLKSEGYKDTKSIYNSVYSWKFKCWVNDNSSSEQSKTTIAPNDSVYIHVSALSGPIDESVNLKFVNYAYTSIDEDYEKSLEDNDSVAAFGTTSVSFQHSFYVRDSSATKCYVEIYNSDTGKLIDTIYFNY